MAYSVTKQNDGDLSLGNLRGELVNLLPAVSDYPTGGYALQGIGGNPLTSGNVGMDKILAVAPVGGQGGYVPVFNPSTNKLQMFQQSAATGPLTECTANEDLSAQTFSLLLIGL